MNKKLLLQLTLLLGLIHSSPAFAFQVADGAPPRPTPASKYIFYWGQHQCDLLESAGFKGMLVLEPMAFRQLLFHPPKVWNGSSIVPYLRFKLDDQPIDAAEYLGQLAQLDATFGPKAFPGNIIRLTEITLEDGVWGSVDISLEEATGEQKQPQRRYSSNLNSNFLNAQFLDDAIWGREDIFNNSNRDFFTVQEFWQNVRQEPVAIWKVYLKPQVLRCNIGFKSKEKTTFSVEGRLDNVPYSGIYTSLQTYQYMVRPGAVVTLELQTAEQYELLYKKTMNIVADDDPRLRLRRDRDMHKFKIQWGDWAETVSNLYLKNILSQNGELVAADEPFFQNHSIPYLEEFRWNWGATKPTVWIDGDEISADISFRVTLPDSSSLKISTVSYDSALVNAFFNQEGLNFDALQIDSVQVTGYDLAPMTFSLFLVKMRDALMARNDFNTLQRLSFNNSRARLKAPIFGKTELEFQFELPERTPISLSIFETDGWNTFLHNESFDAGPDSIKVPRIAFRNKGEHFAFLNTPFGVSKVTFSLD